MAKNWTAVEAAEALYNGTQEEMKEIGNRYPLFTRTVCLLNNEYLLDILKALPKVTARVVETGLSDIAETEEEVTEEVQETKKAQKAETKKAKKQVEEDEDEEEVTEDDYESMTGAELYKLCCKRGISSKCKSRSKAALIEVLRNAENDTEEPEEDEWDEEEEEPKDPYAGKTAKELYMICKERKIKAEPKKKPEEYVKLLKKADANKHQPKQTEPEEDEDEDEWEI